MSIERLRVDLVEFIKAHSRSDEPGMMAAVSDALVLLRSIDSVRRRRGHRASQQEVTGE